jgi:hypothetical protein
MRERFASLRSVRWGRESALGALCLTTYPETKTSTSYGAPTGHEPVPLNHEAIRQHLHDRMAPLAAPRGIFWKPSLEARLFFPRPQRHLNHYWIFLQASRSQIGSSSASSS